MSAIKKTISIDEKIAKEASLLNSNFSAIVETALTEYIRHQRIRKAVNSFGKWVERADTSVDIVSNLRKQDDREYVTHHDEKNEELKPGHH